MTLADALNVIPDPIIRKALFDAFQALAASYNTHYHTLAAGGTQTSAPASGPSNVALAAGASPATFPS
jgi:hypothetical protein